MEPIESQERVRTTLFLDLVPHAIEADAWAQSSDRNHPHNVISTVSDIYPRAALADGEDCRVLAAMRGALDAADAWARDHGFVPGKADYEMQQNYARVLGTYISGELRGYHGWLEHSLAATRSHVAGNVR